MIAQLTVTAPSWNRYKGQISSVPPARSIRVGAFDSILTLTCSLSPASLLVPADSASPRESYQMNSQAQRKTQARDSVLARFMLGFEGDSLSAELAGYLAQGPSGVATSIHAIFPAWSASGNSPLKFAARRAAPS